MKCPFCPNELLINDAFENDYRYCSQSLNKENPLMLNKEHPFFWVQFSNDIEITKYRIVYDLKFSILYDEGSMIVFKNERDYGIHWTEIFNEKMFISPFNVQAINNFLGLIKLFQ